MTSTSSSLPESVLTSFQKLEAAAVALNSVSDELGKSITRIDESLKSLNLGVSVWVPTYQWDDTDEGGSSYRIEEVGYAKVNGRWGICLRKRAGDYASDRENSEEWLFSDAPRSQRLESIGKITDLLEQLSNEAAKMTTKVQAKLAEVKAVADVINPPLPFRPLSAAARASLQKTLGGKS